MKEIKNGLFFLLTTCLLANSALFEMGCRGPKGPTFKEKVNQALEHYYRGEKLERKRDLEGAKAEYLASIEISPRPRGYFRLASVLNSLGNKEEADKYLTEALKLSPGFTLASQAQKQLRGGPTASTTSLSHAVQPQINEATPVILPNTGSVPAVEKPVEKPAAVAGSASAPAAATTKPVTPLDAAAQDMLNQSKQAGDSGDWAKSAQLGEEILKRFPDHPETLYRYGYALFHLNRMADAEKAFRHAVESDPTLAAAYNDLGVTLENLMRTSEAALAYENAIRVGNYSDSYFNLALLKEKEGDYKSAITNYQKYLQQDTKSAYADYARERVQKLQKITY